MSRRFDRALWIGPVAFLVAACAWSMLDAEFACDTWLSLAAGRHLLGQLEWGRFHDTFPRLDPFSYTFFGQPWFNQNWLSNLGHYWIYDRLGASAVAYATWAMVALTHLFVLLSVYWRTQSWLAAWLAAALVGIGTRDFLEPRPATVGLLCLAALWMLVCAIEGQRDRLRWWPIVPLVPLLWFWSNAHGGFVFGYALLVLYCGYWVVARGLGAWRLAASAGQIAAVAAALIAAIALIVLMNPYGIESFARSVTVPTNAAFRAVSEAFPAYVHVRDGYPPMVRFWAIAALAAGGFLLLWLAGKVAARSSPRAQSSGEVLPWSFFDVILVLTCLGMALWARRFTPMLYVVSAAVLAVGVLRLAAPFPSHVRERASVALKLTAALAAIVTGWMTWTAAQRDLIEAFKEQPATGILDRTRGDRRTQRALQFVVQNQLRANLFTEYGDSALVMFYAPLERLYYDARGDQLFDEGIARRYVAVMNPRTPSGQVPGILDRSGTNAVLVRRTAGTVGLRKMLQHSPDWVLAFLTPDYILFLRSGSAPWEQLCRLIREREDWQPSRSGSIAPDAQAARAIVLLSMSPPDRAEALKQLRQAVDREPLLGVLFYPTVVNLLSKSDGRTAALDYVLAQSTRVSSAGLNAEARYTLLASLKELREVLQAGERTEGRRGAPASNEPTRER